MQGGTGAILTGHAQRTAVVVVDGAEDVLEDVAIERLIHRDGEDVLHRVLVVYGEVVLVVLREGVALCLQLVAVADAGLQVGRVGGGCRAWSAGIDPLREHEFGQQERCHGARHATVVLPLVVAALVGQQGQDALQLAHNP